jgi:hypothetical protein
MAVSGPPAEAQRLVCPACSRYLGTVEGCYSEYPPCVCGIQTTVRLTGKRRVVEMNGEQIEVKAR